MAVKTAKNGRRGVSHGNEAAGRIVLVGTYKGDQLTKWRGWYNYPIADEDQIGAGDAAKITELWLFKGVKERKTYKAEVVGFIDVFAVIGGLHPWRVCA